MQRIHIVIPQDAPTTGDDGIFRAIALFGITVPPNVRDIHFDPALEDRGATSSDSLLGKKVVTIGRSAFTSWSLLGSTLAHELEVHGNQSFVWISLVDTLGWDGTNEAERRAYSHELANTQRFGLSKVDFRHIELTRDTFYPANDDKARPWNVFPSKIRQKILQIAKASHVSLGL